jgi:thiamine kinase-like enzyme
MAEAKGTNRTTVLTHGDLSGEHILVDDRGVSGVIDWESACFEDPVGDVTMLPKADGFADLVSESRFGGRDEDWPRRVAFHRHAVPVYSILFALEHRDLRAVRAELTRYRRTLPVV